MFVMLRLMTDEIAGAQVTVECCCSCIRGVLGSRSSQTIVCDFARLERKRDTVVYANNDGRNKMYGRVFICSESTCIELFFLCIKAISHLTVPSVPRQFRFSRHKYSASNIRGNSNQVKTPVRLSIRASVTDRSLERGI